MDQQQNAAGDVSSADETIQTKFCKHCGAKIPVDAVLCTACGRQVEELKGAPAQQPQIVITNTNTNTNTNVIGAGRPKNKWVALALCFFLGWLGVHRFYEGKVMSGVLWLLTMGLCGVGVFVDFIIILFKPNPYYV